MNVMIDEGVLANQNVFLSYAAGVGKSWTPPRFFWDLAEIRSAVHGPLNARRCLAAYRRLQNFSDEAWDAVEPHLVEEIAVLHELCDLDEDDDA